MQDAELIATIIRDFAEKREFNKRPRVKRDEHSEDRVWLLIIEMILTMNNDLHIEVAQEKGPLKDNKNFSMIPSTARPLTNTKPSTARPLTDTRVKRSIETLIVKAKEKMNFLELNHESQKKKNVLEH